MICPLSFIIAMVMPFIMNIIPQFVGFDLPSLEVDFHRNSILLLIIVGVFRVAPIIGMIAFCLKGNMYVEFLREKWFLVLISLGGGLGSITWLTAGILLNLNYMIDFRESTLKLALRTLKSLIFQSFGGDLFRYFLGSESELDADRYLLTNYD